MKSKITIFEWQFLMVMFIIVCYLVMVYVLSLGSIRYMEVIGHFTGDASAGTTPIKQFLESSGFNLLGDTLSGFIAPITFLIVVFATYLQSHQVKRNIADMAEQNRLAKVTAQAQYKFALHDKRLVVYKNLKSVATDLLQQGTIKKETLFKLIDCVDDAKFVFNGEILQWIDHLFHRSSDLVRLNVRISNAQQKLNEVGLDDDEKDALSTLIDEEHEIEVWLYDELSFGKIDEILTPALQLPDNIE